MSKTKEFLDAAEFGDAERVHALVTATPQDIDLNATNQYGNTALIEASNHGDTDIVKLLVEKGVRLDAVSVGGRTALMCAAKGGHREIVELLLKAGADPNVKDLDDSTALGLAKLGPSATEKAIVQVLLEAGAR